MDGLIDGNIADLALLVRVQEFGGFTAAARATGHPQATVSRRIAQLEKRLGVRLLDRTTRRVALTDAGRRIYDLARSMLDQAEAIGAAAQDLLAEPRGALRIMAPVVLGQAFVGDTAAEFMVRFPRVNVKLELSSRDIDLIEEGFDIAIRIGSVADSSYAIAALGTTSTGLFASPGYVDRADAIEQPSDLSSHRVLALGLSLSDSKLRFLRGGETQSVSPSKRMATNDVQPILAATLQGLGIAVLPHFIGRKFAANGGLVELLPPWRMPSIGISSVTPSTRGALPAVREFVALLKQRLGGSPS